MDIASYLEVFLRDLLYATRTVRKSPAFAGTAVLTLALAIGGNTAMFTVIRAVLLKPLEYRDPDALVRISGGATPARFEEMRAGSRTFTEVGAFAGHENLAFAGGAEPEVLTGVRVSGNFLRILGVDPILGRGFLPEEDSAGGAPVAMISAELWHRRFGGAPGIAGKTAALGAVSYTIIGVLPSGFQFPFPRVDVWLTAPREWPLMPEKSRALSPFLTLFGRLQPGVNLEQANAEMAVLHRRYALAHPTMLDAKPKAEARVTPMKDQLVANVRTMLWMLFGAVGFVLLIACANVASLLLARSAARSREFAVRSALGAARSRLVGQLLAESLLLSSAGGALGVMLAAWSVRGISHMAGLELPRAGEIHLDWMVLLFAAALSIGTGVLFGLAPSFGASQPDLISMLRASSGTSNQGPSKGIGLRGLLVAGQVALCVVLLIGASLLLQSVAQLRSVDVGFNSKNLLTMRISLPLSRYATSQQKTSFFSDLLGRVGTSPGVQSAAVAMFLPMTGFVGSPVQDAGKAPLKLNERPIATILVVTPGYFRTLAIPIRRGRDFSERDSEDAERVAVIDESCARRLWPSYPSGLDPIGQRLLIGGVNARPAQIVGIVANAHQNLENTSWPETVYVSFAQDPQPSAMLAVRTGSDPVRLTKTIREQVSAMDRSQPISDVQTMDDLVEAEVGQRRLIMKLLGLFAGVALLLAVVGIYGVIAYSVAQRVREVGIRRALGAQHGDILRLVVGQGFRLAVAGVVAGICAALALTRVLKSLLFHVSATDPETFVGIALLFIVVALVASFVPAYRASRIDPMAALRVE